MKWSGFLVADERSLLDLVEVVGGGTPSRSEPRYWGGDIPWATVKDLSGAAAIRGTAEHITREGLENSAANVVPAGAIVLATRIVPGKAAIAKVDLAINQDLKGLLPRAGVDAAYLLHFLRSYAPCLARIGVGSTVKGITLETLARVSVSLPALSEQRRIAKMLDRADAIRWKRQECLRLLNVFVRSAFLEIFGDPIQNAKGFDVTSLGDVALFSGGGTPSRTEPKFYSGSIAWASSKDIISEELFDTQEHVTSDAVAQNATRIVPPGSILIVVKSKILLHRLPVAIARVPVCFNQDIKAIRMRDNRLPTSFVARHLRIGEHALLTKARGANTEGLTLEHLRNYALLMPPPDLLERWDRIEMKVSGLRNAFQQNLSRSTSLFEALAQETFSPLSNRETGGIWPVELC